MVLMYASNSCYTNVVGPDDKRVREAKVTIDADSGTWTESKSFGYSGEQTYKIGESRHCGRGSRWGVIGVYDRTDIAQLDSMVHAAREATQKDRYSDD